MSLVSTLARVAMGVMIAKGVGKVLGGKRGSASTGGGGLGGMLGSVLGGKSGTAGGTGGMGDLGALLGGKNAGAAQAPEGGLGGLLDSIGGGAAGGNSGSAGGLGDLLNSALQGNQPAQPTASQEAQAELLIRAMINAAKADGNIDQAEQQKIVEHLGNDISEAERNFVLGEMRAPLNVESFVSSVPRGAEQQVYLMSLMGIDLDSRAEAEYLDKLRQGMGLSESVCNALHQQLGAPVLYS